MKTARLLEDSGQLVFNDIPTPTATRTKCGSETRELDMNINRNPVQAADAVVIAEMRAANIENKRKVIDPEARSDSDAILLAEPPAPEGVRYERGLLAGVPGWWCRSGNAVPGAGLLYFHGGGYVVGTAAEARYLAAKLVGLSRAEAFVLTIGKRPRTRSRQRWRTPCRSMRRCRQSRRRSC